MKKPNEKQMLDSIINALKLNPEGDRLRLCPNCWTFHVVEHLGQDFCGPKCNNEYNNRKKKLALLSEGGLVKDLRYASDKFLIDDDLFEAPTIKELADENNKLLDHIEKLINQNKILISQRDAALNEKNIAVNQKDLTISERDATIEKQLKIEKEKDIIISQQAAKLLEFEKMTDAGKKDFILWCLITGAIKTAILLARGAVIDTWNGRATLYGFHFEKKYMRDEYVLSPGQGIR